MYLRQTKFLDTSFSKFVDILDLLVQLVFRFFNNHQFLRNLKHHLDVFRVHTPQMSALKSNISKREIGRKIEQNLKNIFVMFFLSKIFFSSILQLIIFLKYLRIKGQPFCIFTFIFTSKPQRRVLQKRIFNTVIQNRSRTYTQDGTSLRIIRSLSQHESQILFLPLSRRLFEQSVASILKRVESRTININFLNNSTYSLILDSPKGSKFGPVQRFNSLSTPLQIDISALYTNNFLNT